MMSLFFSILLVSGLELQTEVSSENDQRDTGSVSSSAGKVNKDEAKIELMEAALEQWLQEVEFVSRFRYVPGRAKSMEAGISRNWEIEFSDQSIQGLSNKAFGKFRVSFDYEGEPQFVSKTADSYEVARLDFDEISNSDILLSYRPQIYPGKPEGAALFTPRKHPTGSRVRTLGTYAAGLNSERFLSPLTLTGSLPGNCLQSPDSAKSVSRQLVKFDNEHAVISVKFVDNGYTINKQVVFSLTGSHPVAIRRNTVMVGLASDRWESVIQGFDFVECPGGPVPSIVRSVNTHKDPKHPDLPFVAYEWRSDDLGKRTPTPEDFLIAVHDKTSIQGITDIDAIMTNGKLDIDKVSFQNMKFRHLPNNIIDQQEFSQIEQSKGSGKIILLVNGVILIAAISVFLFFRFRRKI